MPIYKTNNQKNGLFQYRVIVSYVASDGTYKQRQKRVYGLKEAKEAERSLLLSSSESPSYYTVGDLFEEYVAHKEVRESSLAKTKTIFENHILPTQRNIKLKTLSKKELLEWKKHINNKDISIVTKKNIFKEYSAMLNWAVKTDKLEKNHLSQLGNFVDVYYTPTEEKLRYYTAEQYAKYREAMIEHNETLSDYCYYVFFSIAFYTGMRKGEINALKWNDIEENFIHVRRSVSQKINGKKIIETPPKTKSSYRTLQIPKPLKEILNEHYDRLSKMDNFSEEWRVCGGIKCLSDTSLGNYNRKYAKAAGLPHITIHEFRHSHASLLCNEGISIQEIARRLGHSDVQITWKTYAHLYPREEERAVEILNRI
jgi:integrase